MQRESSSHVEPVGFVVIHFREQFFALLDNHVACRAGAVSSAGMIEKEIVVHGYIKERLGLTVVGIGQLPFFKLEGLVRRHERHANCIRTRLFHRGDSLTAAFAFVIGHKNSFSSYRLCSNSAGAMGWGAVGPSPTSESALFIVLPLIASDTAESIMSSARCIVPSFRASMAARIVL